MPMGHLMLGLLGGLLATLAALAAGLPVWMAVLLYSGTGSFCFMASVLAELLLLRMRRPPKSPPRRVRPVPVGRMAAQPVRVRI